MCGAIATTFITIVVVILVLIIGSAKGCQHVKEHGVKGATEQIWEGEKAQKEKDRED